MKEFIDKLISRLEEKLLEYINKANDEMIENGHTLDFENLLGHKEAYENVLYGIVNELAEEYKVSEMPTGWIPCSSGYFSTSEVLVCKEDGTIDFDVYDFMDNDWKFNSNHHKNKVIAWQPLPAPLKEGE